MAYITICNGIMFHIYMILIIQYSKAIINATRSSVPCTLFFTMARHEDKVLGAFLTCLP